MITRVPPRGLTQREGDEQTELRFADRIQVEFEAFHAKNPDVYRRLVTMARALKAKGHEHYSIDSLYSALRFEFDLQCTTLSAYKLNNNYHSRYARLIMQREADLVGFFRLRALTAA